MERPEQEPVSMVTHLIRIMEKHIKKMSKALDDLEKTDFPHKYLPGAESGKEGLREELGENENPASKP